jgi:hypothetical protein
VLAAAAAAAGACARRPGTAAQGSLGTRARGHALPSGRPPGPPACLPNTHPRLPCPQVVLTLAMGYMSYYVANSPCKFSGVIAVAVYGLYGAATDK